jgi:hypothetical protein
MAGCCFGTSLRDTTLQPAGEWLQSLARESRGLGRDCRAAISPHVKTFLAILVGLLMFATLGVLFAGLFGLVRGGGDPARSNQLMRWRIILQGAALLLFALLMTLLRS